MKFVNKVLYFIIVVVLFQAVGVIIPIVIDYAQNEGITFFSKSVTPYNLATYAISIFLVAMVKRVLVFVDDSKYRHKKLEILLLTLLLLIQGVLIFFTYSNIYHENFDRALMLNLFVVMISWLLWWWAFKDDTITDPFSALGGKI